MRSPWFVPFLLVGCMTSPDDLSSDTSSLHITVDPAKELVITDPRVIASPLETRFDPSHPSGRHPAGAWSFGRLVHNMLPPASRNSRAAASQLVMGWLKTWETDQQPNPTVTAARARPAIRLLITEPWKTASGCADPTSPETDASCLLDFTKAPLRLMAIVNRPDLRIIRDDDTAIGGEGRFVFQVVGPTLGVDAATNALRIMDPAIKPQKFTVILEYSLPVSHRIETLIWAHRWHMLGLLPFGIGFNAVLRTITHDFAGPDADRRRPNGNALNQVRTNEVALMGARFPTTGFVAAKQFWELREFRLTSAGLAPHTVNLEPSRLFDVSRATQVDGEGTRTAELELFLGQHAAEVVAEEFRLPHALSGNSALVGTAPYGAWGKRTNPNPPTIPSAGITSDFVDVPVEVRDSFAINTCAGCHRHETDTRHFMHITSVAAMEPADKVDDRARIGVGPNSPEDAIVLSNLLAADIAPGGERHADFSALLSTKPSALVTRKGRRACAR
jgi:hypothetical protein